jgi:outer membrane murein-binding lipoprotein Lpp
MAVSAMLLGTFVLSGCAKKNDTPEAVKQGVIRDLATKFDLTKMDVIVDAVRFRDKEADATVTFAVKGGNASDGMTMNYVMERHDDGQWYIKSRSSADGGTKSTLPPGHPGMGQ